MVSSLTNVKAISAGYYHALALKNDGTVWGWGYNVNGQLGVGNYTDTNVPVTIPNFTTVTRISGGRSFSLASKADGTVWAWGRNDRGQLANGTNTSGNVPVQATSISNATVLYAGEQHAVARKSDGSGWTWGDNSNGQLGDGTIVSSNVALSVPGLCQVLSATANAEMPTVAIYPNPNLGQFNLAVSKANGTVEVYNLIGAKVYQAEVRGLEAQIDLSAQPKGLYILKYYSGNTVQTGRVVIE